METLPDLPSSPANPQETQPSNPSAQPQPPTPLVAEAPPPEIQKPLWLRKWLILLIVVGVLMFLLLFGWWLYQISQRTQPSPIQETDNQTAMTGFSDIADNWKLYTSQNCRYQISYPPDWHIYTEGEQEDLSTILISSNQIQNETIALKDVRIQIGCSSVDTTLDTKTVVDDLNTRYQGKGFTISTTLQTIVAEKPAYVQTISSSQAGILKEYYIFPISGRVIIVNIVPSNSVQINSADSIINKIVFAD